MAGMLKLSNQEFQTTMINMLSVLMDKIENMEEQLGNESSEMEIIKKKQREMLEQKHCKRNKECLS